MSRIFLSIAAVAFFATAAPAQADMNVRGMITAGIGAFAADRCARNETCSNVVGNRVASYRQGGAADGMGRAIVDRYGPRLVERCMSSRFCQEQMTEIVRFGTMRDMDELFERVAGR